MTSGKDVGEGLEGVVAGASAVSDADPAAGVLRYRGVDLSELAGHVPFERVWALLVDGGGDRALQAAPFIPATALSGDARVDLQAALAEMTPQRHFTPLLETEPAVAREQLAAAAAAVPSVVARSARGGGRAPVPERVVDQGRSLAERFLLRWRGESDPDRVRALDAYWVCAAEHGLNSSTFAARVIASTGADVGAALSGAVGALSGPLHGGAPERVLKMLDDVEREGDAGRYVARLLDRHERLMGFGNRIYRDVDPRARALQRIALTLPSPRLAVATELEQAALAELAARRPGRPLPTNLEFWAAIVLDYVGAPPTLFTALFACARVAGWSAHILEQRVRGRLIRPTSFYVGPEPKSYAEAVAGPLASNR